MADLFFRQVLTYTVNPTAAGSPQYPACFSSPSSNFAVKPSVYGFAPNFKTQYAHQDDLQIEQQITPNTSITVDTEVYLGRRAPVPIDVNLGAPIGTLADSRPRFSGATRPNTAYNQIFQLTSIGGSTYYGGFIQFNKRLSHSFSSPPPTPSVGVSITATPPGTMASAPSTPPISTPTTVSPPATSVVDSSSRESGSRALPASRLHQHALRSLDDCS